MAQSRGQFKRLMLGRDKSAQGTASAVPVRALAPGRRLRYAFAPAKPVWIDTRLATQYRGPLMVMSREDLLGYLARLGVETQTVEHPPLFTVEDSRKLRGEIPGAHTKNLFLKCKKGQLWLVTALEDASIDLKSLHHKLGSGRLSFGSAELLGEVLGVTPGAVSTFGVINDTENRVSVVLDEGLMRFDRINLHPLVNTATIGISREGLISFLRSCGHPPKILALGETV